MTMESCLQVLVVCDERHGADILVHEIGELFEGCIPAVCDPPGALWMLRARSFDLAIFHAKSGDVGIVEVVQTIRHLAADLPIIVSLPADGGISARQLSSLREVYCLVRSNGYPTTVSTVIEEVLRMPVGGSVNWIGQKERPTETQAEMMRTAAGTLSHEINNPLMAILGISELILKEGKKHNPDVARKVTMIRKSAERIESSLKRLSNISEPSIRPTPAGSIVDIEPHAQTRRKRKTRSDLSNSVDK
jgi:signal transduction histidine kinase